VPAKTDLFAPKKAIIGPIFTAAIFLPVSPDKQKYSSLCALRASAVR
jgi:hypothetical protein